MAVIEVDRGRTEQGLAQFREAIAIAERAVAIEPQLLPAQLRATRSVERICSKASSISASPACSRPRRRPRLPSGTSGDLF
jgi:hypothetical protein